MSVEVTVRGDALSACRDSALHVLGQAAVPQAVAAKDPTVWGPDATPEATIRLGWLDIVTRAGDLVPQVLALRQQLADEGVHRVVLAGMGGSSLAPEVICATAGAALVVLDTTDPAQVRAALTELEHTVVVCSSKSGGTVETDSHRRAARAAFQAAGIDPAQRIVVVTDPGSPLADTARQEGSRAVFLADPDVGGRYSALTAFGLVPAGLAGVDIAGLVAEAEAERSHLADPDGAAVRLGAVLAGGAVAGRDKAVLVPATGAPAGFGDWAEQLIAESTGKQGKGILPVVVEGPGAPGTEPAADTQLVVLGGGGTPTGAPPPPAQDAPADSTAVAGPLGGQFLVWEFATALTGRVLGINPFDQPNVQESKDNTGAILAGGSPPVTEPVLVAGPVEVYATGDLLADARDLAGALDALLAAVPDRGYLAVMAYLDRQADAAAAGLRAALARRTAHPVTFGWAPRFLHSTGQYHKGGPHVGVFLQITGAVARDLEVPGRDYSFGQLQAAQAAGDLRALASRDRPVLRLHLTDRAAGLAAVRAAVDAGAVA